MVNRPAQVPGFNPNQSPAQWSRDVAPAQYQYPAPQSPAQANFNRPAEVAYPPVSEGERRNGLFATPLRAIGTTATALVVGAGAVFGGNLAYAKYQEHQIMTQLDYDRPDQVQPNLDTSEQLVRPTLSPETVTLIKSFDAQRDVVLAAMLDKFARDGFTMEQFRTYEGREIEAGSPDLSPQAVLDRFMAKQYFASANNSPTQVDIIARPETDGYNDVKDAISHAITTGAVISDENILIKSKRFDNGILRDPATGEVIASANDTPTLITSSMSQRFRTNAVRIFQYEESTDGQSGDWRLTYGSNAEDSAFDINTIDLITIEPNR